MQCKRIYFFIIFILVFFSLNAQHESDFWYFGDYAGLDFSSGNPEPIADGVLKNYEGSAVASDTTGSLLFYTNGITVWNKNHEIMVNGTNLMGDSSSSQSAIIVPYPDKDSIFYIFTADDLHNSKNKEYITDGFRYSIVNMNKSLGLGEVTTKNILLLDSVTEKNSAVLHQNNKDIWVVTHEWGTNDFYAWLVDEDGLNPVPVISSIGSFHQGSGNSLGYLKFSPDGNKLVLAILFSSKYEILDFDRSTGIVSNRISIYFTFPETAYGCEFSPDGSKLYLTTQYKLHQADMDAGNETDIRNSVTEIGEFDTPVGALQLAKNGKLYITTDNSEYLSVVNQPNEFLPTCDLEKYKIFLDGRLSRLGLPNFIQSYFKEPFIKALSTCYNDPTMFSIQNILDIDSVVWNFDDPLSGAFNSSKELNPDHIFTNSGIFKVTLTVWYNNVDTHCFQNVKIVPLPELNIGNDTILCVAENFEINAYHKHYSYLWNDLSTDSILNVLSNGKYWVDIENVYTACKNSDTINVGFSEIPFVDIGTDTSFCENSSYLIDAYNENYTYTWQDGSHEAKFIAFDEGNYFVKVTNEFGCENSDSVLLIHELIPIFDFPEDTTLCEGFVFGLNPGIEDVDYLWQDGSTESSFFIYESGNYKLITENRCGTWTDSIRVNYEFCGDLHIPNVISPNSDGINDLFFIRGIESSTWQLVIYNRWGQEVIRYQDYDNSWAGKDSFDHDVSTGAYFYVLSNQELEALYKGTIRVVR